ncbi:MAG: acyl-CoA dehydrogenase family protein, partial [Myxococcota bacterium]|nr:acyl-CoA dehydrogenase family protein [Myxococcota bacterium]
MIDYDRMFALLDRVPMLADLDGFAPGLRALPKANWEQHEKAWRAGRKFARETIYPMSGDHEKAMGKDPYFIDPTFMKRAAEARLFSIACGEGYGGSGLASTGSALVMEELCAGCAGLANIVGAHLLGLVGLLFTRNLELSGRVQQEVCEGERQGRPLVMAAAITEPGAGSDVEDSELMETARICTTATRIDGGFLLSGTKVFISNGSFARYIVVGAALDKSRPRQTWSMFLVDTQSAGFEVGRVESKMGMKANPATQIHLEEVFVPDAQVISDRLGDGMDSTEALLGASRGPVGAIATGIARGALERFLYFASVNTREGETLLSRPEIQDLIAESFEDLCSSRATWMAATLAFDRLGLGSVMGSPTYRILSMRGATLARRLISRRPEARQWLASRIDDGFAKINDDILAHASLAKRVCSESALQVITRLMDAMGPAALDPEWGMEKAWRDAKLTQIYEGTNQLNRV